MASDDLLPHKIDSYDGVHVTELPDTIELLTLKITPSLTSWISTKKKGVWIKVPIHQSQYIPVLHKNGFQFHHAINDYSMLVRWLPTDAENKIPQWATSTIGVGGFVLNDAGEVLVVSEKYSPLHKHGQPRKRFYKLPGGYVNAGENIQDAVEREVLEETGIKAKFISVVCFRQMFPNQFGRTDFYFVCRLKALSSKITKEEAEIEACEWMPLQTYINHPDVLQTNKAIANLVMQNSTEFVIHPTDNTFKRLINDLYGPQSTNTNTLSTTNTNNSKQTSNL